MNTTGRHHPDDDSFLADLGEAVEAAEAVPDWVREAGYVAFAMRQLDLELEMLTLVRDSVVEPPVGVRAGDGEGPRVVVFESGDLTLEVEIGPATLMGHVVPASVDRVQLETRDGETQETETDDGGFFLLSRPATSPVRLRLHGADTALVTDWFPI